MSKLIITTNLAREMKKVLNAAYKADRSATFCSKNSVSGSTLTAIARGNEVEITSNYYFETTLCEMFSQFI